MKDYQRALCEYVGKHPGATYKDISAALDRDVSTISKSTKVLIKSGYLRVTSILNKAIGGRIECHFFRTEKSLVALVINSRTAHKKRLAEARNAMAMPELCHVMHSFVAESVRGNHAANAI
jgi:hypothetical protein